MLTFRLLFGSSRVIYKKEKKINCNEIVTFPASTNLFFFAEFTPTWPLTQSRDTLHPKWCSRTRQAKVINPYL